MSQVFMIPCLYKNVLATTHSLIKAPTLTIVESALSPIIIRVLLDLMIDLTKYRCVGIINHSLGKDGWSLSW